MHFSPHVASRSTRQLHASAADTPGISTLRPRHEPTQHPKEKWRTPRTLLGRGGEQIQLLCMSFGAVLMCVETSLIYECFCFEDMRV
eukprot:354437-Pyramimonas_sp.AAC.1